MLVFIVCWFHCEYKTYVSINSMGAHPPPGRLSGIFNCTCSQGRAYLSLVSPFSRILVRNACMFTRPCVLRINHGGHTHFRLFSCPYCWYIDFTFAVWYCYYNIKFWDFNILIKTFWNEIATESILNTVILIRDRACIRVFGSKILRKLIFCPQGLGICVNVSPQGWGFCCIIWTPWWGICNIFSPKWQMPDKRPGGGDGHPWNWLRHYLIVNRI